eukprot:6268890-Pyramimonas_sp.AAC.1
MQLMRTGGPRLTDEETHEFMATFKEHVSALRDAAVKFKPKHHLWCHLTLLAGRNGNPKYHSCFLDESLNGVVAVVAKSSHALNWERHVFSRLRLEPKVNADSYFAAA